MQRTKLVALVVSLATLAVVLQSLKAFPVTGDAVLRVLGYAAGLVFVAGALMGWGQRLAARLGFEGHPEAAFGIGLGLLGMLVGAFSWLAVPSTLASLGLFALGWAFLVLNWRSVSLALMGGGRSTWTAPSVASALFLLPPLLLALAPPISIDALVYHLAVPRQYLLRGNAFEMPWSVHSGFVRLVETIFGMTLNIDRWGILAQLCSWSFALVTLLAVGRLGRRLFGGSAGVWGALLLVSLPTLNVVAGWAWTDWAVVLFTVLAVDAWSRFQQEPSTTSIVAVGVFVGAAVATKYTALPLLALPLLCVLDGASSRKAAVALGCAAIPGLPWTVHNLLTHRNPVFPLFTEAAREMGQYRGEAGLVERIQGYFGRPDLLDESLGLIFFPALVLALALRVAPWERYRTLYCQALLCLAAGLVFHPTVRGFAPVLALGCVLGGAGLARALDSELLLGSRLARACGGAVIGLALLVNGIQIAWIFEEYAPISSALGFESREDYLASGQSYYKSFKAIEANSEPEDGVLLVGESRAFYLDRPVVAASYIDSHPLGTFAVGGCTGECLAQRLVNAGIRTVFVDTSRYRPTASVEANRGTNELQFFVTSEEDRLFQELLRSSAQRVHTDGAVQVYRLVEGTGSSP